MATSTTSVKMTNKAALNYVLDNFDLPEDVADKLSTMVVQLEKKSGAERKPTARQIENAKLAEVIQGQFESGVSYSVSDILKTFTGLPEDMSCQRLSGILTKLVDAGTVQRELVKRVPYFSIVEG